MFQPLHGLAERAHQLSEQLIQWRRHFHQHPELSFQEFDTAAFVAGILEKIPGMKVQKGVAKTGVISTLSTGAGPTIAIRADMDALPIQEQNTHSFCSRHPGVMHACGHDAHTAILLGAATLLGESFAKGELCGTIRFLFQPAEENADENGWTGAPYMIQEGALQGVDAAIALHMDPTTPVGTFVTHAGYSMANVDNFEGVIRGTGGHAAYPHLGTDPVWMLGSVLQGLYGIVARKVSPLQAAVVSVSQVQSGTSDNVIPTEVTVKGTMRSYDPDVREQLVNEVENAFSIAKSLGGDYRLQIVRGEPALNNHPDVDRWIRQTIQDLYPSAIVKQQPFGLGGEDFGHMAAKIPAAMFFLGAAVPDDLQRDLHTPIFDIDENCLPMGTAVLAETAVRYLQGKYQLNQNRLGEGV